MTDPIFLEIETAIRPVSRYTIQVGQKSLQRITVSFGTHEITSQVITGHTGILGAKLKSTRDDFKLLRKGFTADGSRAFFDVVGQTASRALCFLAINYSFRFELTRGSLAFRGAHDGYPSYKLAVNGKVVYDFVQGFMGELAGDSDVIVERKDVKIE